MKVGDQFPAESEKERLSNYDRFGKLLEGDHFEAFGIKSADFTKEYAQLRYIAINFAGLVARLCGDMLFGETMQIKAENNQDWLEDLWYRNELHTRMFESAMNNSAHGDALIKIRVENNEIVIENTDPSLYFPELTNSKLQQKPKTECLCWVETYANPDIKDAEKELKYLICERHSYENADGRIDISIWKLKADKIEQQIDVGTYNAIYGKAYVGYTPTGLTDRNLLIHIPNFRTNYKFFGTSDLKDIENMIFALNNRFTKNDNILDKHSDPILALPPGILDENGKVNKKALGMIELPADGEGMKPEYIVWNANLEAAFKQIDKLEEFMFLISETSPDAFGLGQSGIPASGRALKLRLLRTIAKINRKRNYYEQAIYKILETAQMLSQKSGYMVNGNKIKEVDDVELIWSDGIVNDDTETIANESAKVEAGFQSKKRATMAVNNVDESEADLILEEVEDEKQAFVPFWGTSQGKIPSNGVAGGVPTKPTVVNVPPQTTPITVPTNGANPAGN